jgi:hypothetical protein
LEWTWRGLEAKFRGEKLYSLSKEGSGSTLLISQENFPIAGLTIVEEEWSQYQARETMSHVFKIEEAT